MNVKWIFLACFLPWMVACSEGGSPSPAVKNYVVKGDPDLIVAGSQMSPQSLLTKDNVQELSHYALHFLVTFQQKEKAKDPAADQGDLERKNAPPTEESKEISYRVVVQAVDRETTVLEFAGFPIQMVLKEDGAGRLQLVAMKSGQESLDVTALHWSATADKSVFSVLFKYQDAINGKGVGAIYLKREAEKKKRPLYSRVYQYLAGPGVGVKWNSETTLELEVCGADEDLAHSRNGVALWSEALKGRLDIRLKATKKFKPFSDLKQRCIYAIDLYDNAPEAYNFGVTVPILDRGSGEIIDSDIIIFNKAFERAKEKLKEKETSEYALLYALDRYKSITYTHELGHLLGLHHQFDGTKSIMSYEFDATSLSDYDVKAIQELYPKK